MTNWKTYELGEIVELSSAKYYPGKSTESYRCIELEHISQGTGRLLGYIDSNEQKSTKNFFQANQVLYGKLRPYLKKYLQPSFSGACSSEIWVLNGIKNKLSNEYLFYFVQSDLFNKYTNISSGTKMPRADWSFVSQNVIKIPPLAEQQKISTILSTWDKAIELKEKLVEEKKKQKNGLMQKLLTGEVRLPGFDGEWGEFQIKDLLDYEQPSKYIVSEILDYLPNLTPVLTANKSFILGSTMEKQGVYKEIPVIIFDDFTMDNKYVDFEFKVKSSAIKILIAKENKSDIKFMYELIQFVDVPKGNHKRYYISEYQERYVFVPTLDEQIVISKIASTADKEIDLLHQELQALKLQKKGLMQLLLTGIVRVNTES